MLPALSTRRLVKLSLMPTGRSADKETLIFKTDNAHVTCAWSGFLFLGPARPPSLGVCACFISWGFRLFVKPFFLRRILCVFASKNRFLRKNKGGLTKRLLPASSVRLDSFVKEAAPALASRFAVFVSLGSCFVAPPARPLHA